MVLIFEMDTEEEFLEMIQRIKSRRRCPFKKIAFREMWTRSKEHEKGSAIANQITVIKLLSEVMIIKFFSENFDVTNELAEELKKEKYTIIDAQVFH